MSDNSHGLENSRHEAKAAKDSVPWPVPPRPDPRDVMSAEEYDAWLTAWCRVLDKMRRAERRPWWRRLAWMVGR